MAAETDWIDALPLWPALPVCDAASAAAGLTRPPALSSLVFDVLNDTLCFALRETPRESLFSTCSVCLDVQGAPGQLFVEAAWLDALCGHLGLARSADTDWSQAAPAVRVFLLSWILAGLLDRLGALFGDVPVLQAKAVRQDAGPGWRRLALISGADTDAQTPCIWLDLPESAFRRLPREGAVHRDGYWHQFPVMASVQAGSQRLRLDQLASLKPGDIVLLSKPLEGLHLALTPALLADVRAQAQGYVITNSWYIDERREVAVNTIHPEADAVHADLLDQMTMQLVCEVGRISMSLSALKSLTPGSVLPMERRAGEAVDLIVNGQKIGQGELVRLDDALGVRVTRLADVNG